MDLYTILIYGTKLLKCLFLLFSSETVSSSEGSEAVFKTKKDELGCVTDVLYKPDISGKTLCIEAG